MRRFQGYIAALDPLKATRTGKDFDAEAYTQKCIEESNEAGGLFLLAEDEGKLVGLLVAHLEHTDEKDQLDEFSTKKGVIAELYVEEAHRGQKVGFALMSTAEAHFKALGCTSLLVDCFAPNTSAHAFYERFGFSDRLITMRKEL